MNGAAERKAIVTLPSSGDEAYMHRLSCLTDEERRIIIEKIPVPLNLADEIIRKVLDYRTIPDEEFLEETKRIVDENRETFTMLSRL